MSTAQERRKEYYEMFGSFDQTRIGEVRRQNEVSYNAVAGAKTRTRTAQICKIVSLLESSSESNLTEQHNTIRNDYQKVLIGFSEILVNYDSSWTETSRDTNSEPFKPTDKDQIFFDNGNGNGQTSHKIINIIPVDVLDLGVYEATIR